VLLGAGASRGASFVRRDSHAAPPLDLDFFQQLARIGHSGSAKRLLEFVRDEYGHEVGLSMERFFSEADYTNRFHHEMNVDPGPYVKRYQKALKDFLTVLPRLLHATAAQECRYHSALVEQLNTIDCVVSFNYDCVMDRALRDHAEKQWDPEKGSYGFAVNKGAEAWRRHTKGRARKQSIRHLKLHGSMNWRVDTDDQTVDLVEDLSGVESLEGAIIPPTWFKDLTAWPFGEIWKQARKEIRTARIMVVVGYSVPDTDLFSRSLLKVEAGSKEKREKLDLLVLVNPDRDARRRFLDLMRGGIESSTTILEYDVLSELDHLLRRNRATTADDDMAMEAQLRGELMDRVLWKLVEEELSGLSQDEQKVLFLLEMGRSIEHVAALLGLSREEVKSMHSRGREYFGMDEGELPPQTA